MRKLVVALVGVVLLLLAYLLFWPVPIDPQAWTPPTPPELSGDYAPNHLLAAVERLGEGVGIGPEDVAIDSRGQIHAGYKDGRIVRFQPDGTEPVVLAETGGRPLGLAFDQAENLLVCDSPRGLLSITPEGGMTVLSTEHGGDPYLLADDVDVGSDGTIYFSDASHRFTVANAVADLMEHRPNGRLLAFDPESGTVRLLLDELYFANGVAVSPDQSFVLVAETAKYRVRRYWLDGPRAGETDIFIDNLPGFPDGVSTGSSGTFWVALVSPRKADLDAILPQPAVRKIVMRLPDDRQRGLSSLVSRTSPPASWRT